MQLKNSVFFYNENSKQQPIDIAAAIPARAEEGPIQGIWMQTDDPGNFRGYFSFGKGDELVPFQLCKYRVPLHVRYANEIFIPAADLSITPYPGLRWKFYSLIPHTSLLIRW